MFQSDYEKLKSVPLFSPVFLWFTVINWDNTIRLFHTHKHIKSSCLYVETGELWACPVQTPPLPAAVTESSGKNNKGKRGKREGGGGPWSHPLNAGQVDSESSQVCSGVCVCLFSVSWALCTSHAVFVHRMFVWSNPITRPGLSASVCQTDRQTE